MGSGPAKGRARLPLTSQVDGVRGSRMLAGRQVVQVEQAVEPARGEPLEPERQPGRDQAPTVRSKAGKPGEPGRIAGDGQVRPILQDATRPAG